MLYGEIDSWLENADSELEKYKSDLSDSLYNNYNFLSNTIYDITDCTESLEWNNGYWYFENSSYTNEKTYSNAHIVTDYINVCDGIMVSYTNNQYAIGLRFFNKNKIWVSSYSPNTFENGKIYNDAAYCIILVRNIGSDITEWGTISPEDINEVGISVSIYDNALTDLKSNIESILNYYTQLSIDWQVKYYSSTLGYYSGERETRYLTPVDEFIIANNKQMSISLSDYSKYQYAVYCIGDDYSPISTQYMIREDTTWSDNYAYIVLLYFQETEIIDGTSYPIEITTDEVENINPIITIISEESIPAIIETTASLQSQINTLETNIDSVSKSVASSLAEAVSNSGSSVMNVNSNWVWEGCIWDVSTGERDNTPTYKSQLRSRNLISPRYSRIYALYPSGGYYFMALCYNKTSGEYLGRLTVNGTISSSTNLLNSDCLLTDLIFSSYSDYKFAINLIYIINNELLEISLNDAVDYYALYSTEELHSQMVENTGIYNFRKSCYQWSSLRWTPIRNMPMADKYQKMYFNAGTEYRGVPYSSVWAYGTFIGYNITLHTFMTCLKNPNGIIYTESYANSSGIQPYYGVVCTSSASYHTNQEYINTNALMSSYNTLKTNTGSYDIRIGDTWTRLNPAHTLMITNVLYDNNGYINFIELSEATLNTVTHDFSTAGTNTINYMRKLPIFSTRLVTVEDAMEYYNSDVYDWKMYRNDTQLATKEYESSKFVSVEVEDDSNYTYNTDLMLNLGDKSNYEVSGSVLPTITFYDYTLKSYPYLLIYKNDELINTINLNEESLTSGYSSTSLGIASNSYITLNNLEAGYYKACLSIDSSGSTITNYCYWNMMDINITIESYSSSSKSCIISWQINSGIPVQIDEWSSGIQAHHSISNQTENGSETFNMSTSSTSIVICCKSNYGCICKWVELQ